MRQEVTSFPAVFLAENNMGRRLAKGDTTAVITWAEKLLHGLRNTVVTTWASLSKN